MISDDLRRLLIPTSKLTQAIGRRIGSVKTDVDDLSILIQALDHVKETVEIVRDIQIRRYKDL